MSRFLSKIPPTVDERSKLHFAKAIMKIIVDADDSESAPEIVAKVTALKNQIFGARDDFAEVKQHFNKVMLSKESVIEQNIQNADRPLELAARYALLGNYIDFGAMYSVSEEKLDQLLTDAKNVPLDETEFDNLLNDLKTAKKLVYMTDNCGEIVMDKLFIREIKKAFPELEITVLVRGEPVLNDATLQDAVDVGLVDEATVLSNGTNIAGNCIDKISPDAKKAFEAADVLISKGQGNFETLHDCGHNVYYLFLCKCSLFADRFKVDKLSSMLLNDRRMK